MSKPPCKLARRPSQTIAWDVWLPSRQGDKHIGMVEKNRWDDWRATCYVPGWESEENPYPFRRRRDAVRWVYRLYMEEAEHEPAG